MEIHKPKPIHNWREFLKEYAIIVIGMLTALIAGPASAQQVPSFGAGHPMMAGADTSVKYYDFKSAINRRTYRIFVAIPEGAPPKGGFSVVYVLDGNQFFLTASTDLSLRSYLGELRRAVMVGIDHPTSHFREMLQQRTKDLTTPLSPESLEKLRGSDPDLYAMLGFAMNGGVDSFLQVIEKEVKPFISTRAPVNIRDQTMFGHSLGGLTVLRALFTEPAAFRTFLASSPSIWWDDEAVLRDEPSFSRQVTAGRIGPRVFIDVGRLEQDSSSTDLMVTNAVALGTRLAGLKGGPGYTVKTVVFPDETHLSVIPAATSRALTFALAVPPKNPAKEKK
jgi:predicted alpha/beta superfamily hydrolase